MGHTWVVCVCVWRGCVAMAFKLSRAPDEMATPVSGAQSSVLSAEILLAAGHRGRLWLRRRKRAGCLETAGRTSRGSGPGSRGHVNLSGSPRTARS